MPIGASTSSVLSGVVLLALAGLQAAYASGVPRRPWKVTDLERRQYYAFAIASLLIGVGQITDSYAVGGLGIIPAAFGAILMFRRRRRGEDVLGGIWRPRR